MKFELLKAHGSSNDIFIVDGRPDQLFAAPTEVADFVRLVCDRRGPLGSDGLYFVDDSQAVPEAFFFNPDGSSAKLCGNGLRCVGRLVLERRGVDALNVSTGGGRFRVERIVPVAPGVWSVAVELPPVTFRAADVPVVAIGTEHVDAVIPALHPSLRFTGVAVPNSHLVAIVDDYDENELIAVGCAAAHLPEVLPLGANVSFVRQLSRPAEIFVRTFERGAGLTPSCGSGVVASRTVYSRLGHAPADEALVVRNPGGCSTSLLLPGAGGSLIPRLEGNATFVYRAVVDAEQLAHADWGDLDVDVLTDEISAYELFHEDNLRAIRDGGAAV
ncbi:diaminopimelate epimerase [Candidatus Protofrankia californiensis]|uniref:diaminopimelate epimerase n=1 Tax=Candidatus Protofrankia californiensis TaxID=1839754 RepID=UPI0010410CC0|nr:diaminopimelate epimerase [Candidatus Protofrankia californiensis]